MDVRGAWKFRTFTRPSKLIVALFARLTEPLFWNRSSRQIVALFAHLTEPLFWNRSSRQIVALFAHLTEPLFWNRSSRLIVALSALLTASLFWNVRQQSQIEQERLRHLAAQREDAVRAKAAADQNQARRAKNADWAAADARVQQLYQEIDGLSRINEHVLAKSLRQRGAPERVTTTLETNGKP